MRQFLIFISNFLLIACSSSTNNQLTTENYDNNLKNVAIIKSNETLSLIVDNEKFQITKRLYYSSTSGYQLINKSRIDFDCQSPQTLTKDKKTEQRCTLSAPGKVVYSHLNKDGKIYSITKEIDHIKDYGCYAFIGDDTVSCEIYDKTQQQRHNYYLYRKSFDVAATNKDYINFINNYSNNDPDKLIPLAKQEQVTIDKIKAEKLALFRKKLSIGASTNCGLVVDVKNPIIQVQTSSGIYWIKSDQLYPQDIKNCTFTTDGH